MKANDFGPLPEPAFGVLAVDGDTGRWCEAEKGEACFDAEQMIAYAAQAVAAERERCAVAAWIYYMDTCMKRGLPASMADEWCASRAIRGVES